ncbi:hypothetical protein L3V82_11720 [Thiotrichales bacterium 19S3-7]|nr:hypothetical protein [Thiotrichales bacterium 19S3-7]MCF6802881.1 hypothetical protein [Thiotrichales bacterium 19S3-11]
MTICQNHIISQCNRFIYIENNNRYNLPAIDYVDSNGHCLAFSTLHSLFSTIEKLPLWKKVLNEVSNWDQSKTSLNMEIKIDNEGSTETLKSIFLNFIENINIYQQFDLSTDSDVFKIDFPSNDKIFSNLDSLDINQNDIHHAVGSFSNEQLETLLDPKYISNNYVAIGGISHMCSLRYDTTENVYYFYDPNYDDGEKEFKTKQSLIQMLHNTQGVGNELVISLIDINKKK